MSRSPILRCAALAALGALASSATASDADAAARAGLKARIDPATNDVADTTPATAEAQAADVQRSARREKPDYNRMTTRVNAHGAVLLNLNGQVRMYSIARVKPDGDVEETCVTGSELARREAAASEHAQER